MFKKYNAGAYSVATLALVANLPQLMLSILYFTYNSCFTIMLMGYEWVSYAYERKGLRVSSKPRGAQRSTYFLQLPYRFGIPLVVLSALLHWLVSQSIFVIAYDINGRERQEQWRTCGWSPVAVVIVLGILGLMILIILIMGSLAYKRRMPIAGCSSLAISAACHSKDPQSGTSPISEQKLQWGVVEIGADGIGRCAFSSRHVGPLVEGGLYI